MKKLGSCIVLCICLVLMMACGASGIEGKWTAEEEGFSVGVGSISEMEFFSDGSYTSDHPNYSGSYTLENGRLKLEGVLVEPVTVNVKITGNEMTLSFDGGDECVFAKE